MTKVQTTKTQIDKWDDMKLKSDCMAKEQQTERAAIEWAEILSGVLRKQKTHHQCKYWFLTVINASKTVNYLHILDP